MGEHKISTAQLVLLLYLCRSFNILTAGMYNVTGHYGAEHFLAIPVSLAVQILLALPALLLLKKSGRSWSGAAVQTFGRAGTIAPLCGCVYLLAAAGLTLYQIAAFLANAVYPGSSAGFFIVTMGIAACYAAGLGLEGIARSSAILFGLFTVSLLLTFLGTAERVNLLNIRPFLWDAAAVGKGAWLISARSSAIFLFVLLCPKVNGSIRRGYGWYLAAVGILMEAVAFFVSAVLGELAVTEAYPFFMLTTVSQISIFQRMDAIHVGIWVMISFLRVTLFLWAMRELLEDCLPHDEKAKRQKRWILPFFSVLAAGLAEMMEKSRGLASWMLDSFSSGVPLVILLVIIPLFCLIGGEVRRRRRGKEKHSA